MAQAPEVTNIGYTMISDAFHYCALLIHSVAIVAILPLVEAAEGFPQSHIFMRPGRLDQPFTWARTSPYP